MTPFLSIVTWVAIVVAAATLLLDTAIIGYNDGVKDTLTCVQTHPISHCHKEFK